jgi:FkbM family methyltransferase
MLSRKLSGILALLRFDNRWSLILDRLLARPISHYRLGDLEILVDHEGGDANGIRDCLATPMYRSLLAELSLQGRPLKILDLGANVGGFVLLCKNLGYQFEKVVCVELNPNVCRRLHINLARNLGAVATCVNAAVAGNHRVLDLALGAGCSGDSIYSRTAFSPQRHLIDAHTIDSIIENHFGSSAIDLLKMDIEGAEYEVLFSPGHNLMRRCHHVAIELHASDSTKAALEELGRLGFKLVARHPKEPVHLFENRAL